LRGRVCGLPPPSSFTPNVAVRNPEPCGVKVMLSVFPMNSIGHTVARLLAAERRLNATYWSIAEPGLILEGIQFSFLR